MWDHAQGEAMQACVLASTPRNVDPFDIIHLTVYLIHRMFHAYAPFSRLLRPHLHPEEGEVGGHGLSGDSGHTRTCMAEKEKSSDMCYRSAETEKSSDMS